MHKNIFRAYDIRGKIGTEFILDQVYDLACVIASYFVQKNPKLTTVVVGFDGRVHSQQIKEEVCRALQDSGLNVICIGLCPTPVMYFALHTLPVDAGIMITASHNGPEYNGLKINCGINSVWGEEIQEIRVRYENQIAHPARRPVRRSLSEVGSLGDLSDEALAKLEGWDRGTYTDYSLIDIYIQWMATHFAHLKGIRDTIIFDCANGAAGVVVPQLIQAMEWGSALVLYPEVDGTFPHHEADPILEKNARALQQQVLAHHADIGVGFDGDGDRMAPVTASGRLVIGDQLLAIFARDILEHHTHARIVYDIKCSEIVPNAITAQGGVAIVAPSGHSIIKTSLRQHQALLAGELSCHFFFADRYFGYDDGIYAALRLIDLLYRSKKTLDCFVDGLPKTYVTPEFRMECAEDIKPAIVARVQDYFLQKNVQDMTFVDGLRVTTKYGWGLIRASNTQPVICIRCESSSEQGLHSIKKDFYDALQPYIDTPILNQAFEENLCERS